MRGTALASYLVCYSLGPGYHDNILTALCELWDLTGRSKKAVDPCGLLTLQPSKSIKQMLWVGPRFLTWLLRPKLVIIDSPSASPGSPQAGMGEEPRGGGCGGQAEGRGEGGEGRWEHRRSGAGRGGAARSQSPSSPLHGRRKPSGAGEPGGGGGGSGGDGGCRGEGWRGEGGAEPSGDSRGAAERLGRRRGSRCSPRRAPRVGEGRAPADPGAMGCIGSRTVGGYGGRARVRGKLVRGLSSGPLPHPILAPGDLPPGSPGPASRLHFPSIRCGPSIPLPSRLPGFHPSRLVAFSSSPSRRRGPSPTASPPASFFARCSLFPVAPSLHPQAIRVYSAVTRTSGTPLFLKQPLFSEPSLQPQP
ncbi:hypothetical protein ACRRTK_015936 [Alexandromys fortis]